MLFFFPFFFLLIFHAFRLSKLCQSSLWKISWSEGIGSFSALIPLISRPLLGTCQVLSLEWMQGRGGVVSGCPQLKQQWKEAAGDLGPKLKKAKSPLIPCSMWISLYWSLCRVRFIPLRLFFFFLFGREGLFSLQGIYLYSFLIDDTKVGGSYILVKYLSCIDFLSQS